MRLLGAQLSWSRVLTVALAGASTVRAVPLNVEDPGMQLITSRCIVPRYIPQLTNIECQTPLRKPRN